MTATELSLDELIRSRAFFDTAAFNDLIEHLDETIPCGVRGCADEADVSVTKRCCNYGFFSCPRHYARWVRRMTEALGKKVMCARCGDVHTCSFDNFRVVPL